MVCIPQVQRCSGVPWKEQMTVSLEEILAEMPDDRRERIELRAKELIAEELKLRQHRHIAPAESGEHNLGTD